MLGYSLLRLGLFVALAIVAWHSGGALHLSGRRRSRRIARRHVIKM